MLGEFIAYRIVDRPCLLRMLSRFRHLRIPPGIRYWLRRTLCWNLHVRAYQSWRAAGLPWPKLDRCQAVLFVAKGESRRGLPDLGWQAGCSQLRVESVEGRHDTMLSKRGPGSLHQMLPEMFANSRREAIPLQRHTEISLARSA